MYVYIDENNLELEVAPVRRAHWIEINPDIEYTCSCCLEKNDWESRYCPWCGAWMTEETDRCDV